MKKAILVTGVAGSGKTAVCKHIRGLGYDAYDIEETEGMFEMYRKGTREVFKDYENTPEKIKNADWICDVSMLKELLAKQEVDVAFYCGVASNMDDIMPLFSKVILLKASPEKIKERLSSREGTDDMGNTEESRQAVLGWKTWWENEMEKKGVITVNTDGSPEDIAKKIIDVSKI